MTDIFQYWDLIGANPVPFISVAIASAVAGFGLATLIHRGTLSTLRERLGLSQDEVRRLKEADETPPIETSGQIRLTSVQEPPADEGGDDTPLQLSENHDLILEYAANSDGNIVYPHLWAEDSETHQARSRLLFEQLEQWGLMEVVSVHGHQGYRLTHQGLLYWDKDLFD